MKLYAGIRHFLLFIQQLDHLGKRCDRTRDPAREHCHPAYRLVNNGDIGYELHEIAQPYASARNYERGIAHKLAAHEVEHGIFAHAEQECRKGHYQVPGELVFLTDIRDPLCRGIKPRFLSLFGAVGLYNAHPGKHIVHERPGIAFHLPLAVVHLPREAVDRHEQQHQKRHGEEYYEREPPIEHEQHHGNGDQCQKLLHKVRHEPCQELAQLVRIARHALYQLARAAAGQPGKRKRLHLSVNGGAHTDKYPLGGLCHKQPPAHYTGSRYHAEQRHRYDYPYIAAFILRSGRSREVIVHGCLVEYRQNNAYRRNGNKEHPRERKRFHMRFKEGQQPREKLCFTGAAGAGGAALFVRAPAYRAAGHDRVGDIFIVAGGFQLARGGAEVFRAAHIGAAKLGFAVFVARFDGNAAPVADKTYFAGARKIECFHFASIPAADINGFAAHGKGAVHARIIPPEVKQENIRFFVPARRGNGCACRRKRGVYIGFFP